jgi:hypothetical protein
MRRADEPFDPLVGGTIIALTFVVLVAGLLGAGRGGD